MALNNQFVKNRIKKKKKKKKQVSSANVEYFP